MIQYIYFIITKREAFYLFPEWGFGILVANFVDSYVRSSSRSTMSTITINYYGAWQGLMWICVYSYTATWNPFKRFFFDTKFWLRHWYRLIIVDYKTFLAQSKTRRIKILAVELPDVDLAPKYSRNSVHWLHPNVKTRA